MNRIRVLATLVVTFAALAAPAAARAAFTVTPSTTQAAAPAQVSIDATFTATPSSVVLHLPAGLVGNPSPFPACGETTFRSGGCDPGSRVGTATATTLGGLVTATGFVYNLVPHADEPARLGISVGPAGIPIAFNEASVSLRPDGGLDSTISQLDTGGLAINGLGLTLSPDFMTMPTSCGRKTVTMEAPPNAPQSAGFDVTGCGSVPFSPSASISVANPRRVQPSAYTVGLSVPAHNSHVRRAEVVLPAGTTLSPGVAPGLQACSQAQFSGAGCSAASQIGTVSFVTPLLHAPLQGKVFFGVPQGGSYQTLVAVDDHGIHLRLAGRVTLDPGSGRITTVFDDLPQVPFSSFSLSFQGGDRAVLANPGTCGSHALAATLAPWSGNPPRTVGASFTVTGCQSPEPFRPALQVASDSTAAGRPAGALSITISRPDGDQDLARVETRLPPGLAGSLTGVPFCPDDAAASGACPQESRLGSVSALVGSGGAPVRLEGSVYLTGGFEGSLAGLAIVIPGHVGPVDLGTVVVRAGLLLRSDDGGVTVRTGVLPRLVGGVPVSIRSLTLRLDRPGFAINPSGCDVRQVVANLTSTGGATATASAPYQATDCAGLAFAPRLSARIAHRGPKGARRQPRLQTVITVPPGQSATRSVAVRLSKRIAVGLSGIKGFCTPAQAAADACPADSRVGTVTAATPLLPAPLSGAVYIVPVPDRLLPDLRLALGGLVQLRLEGTLDLDHGLTSTFDGIPDVPLSRLALTFLPGGPLQVRGDPCRGAVVRLFGTLAGHNGKTVDTATRAFVTGCPATASSRLGHGTLRVQARHGRDAKRLKSVTVRLPRGVTVRRARATHDGGRRVRRSAISVHRRTLTVRLRRARQATLELELRGHSHGRARVTMTRTNGRRFTVRTHALR